MEPVEVENKLDVYDLPFGKASQTAKRYEDNTSMSKNKFEGKKGSECLEDEEFFSQDLFDSEELYLGTLTAERSHSLSRSLRKQLGVQCGNKARREMVEDKKSHVAKTNKTFPMSFISVERSDLPHPKQLFKKKRTKRLHMSSTKIDLNDKTLSQVHGHIQELKSKLSHRASGKMGSTSDNTDLAVTHEESYKTPTQSPKDTKVKFLTLSEEHEVPTILNESTPRISRTWGTEEFSLYQRWIKDISFVEEE